MKNAENTRHHRTELDSIRGVLENTDWALLARQKVELVRVVQERDKPDDPLDGLINWLDALQDAAANEGLPVVWAGDP
jgi:hypothetical protein